MTCLQIWAFPVFAIQAFKKKITTNLQMEVTICPVDFCYFEKIFHEENEFNRELNNVVVRQPSGLTFSFVPVHVAVPDSR